jgi:hypothetical protein
MHELAGANASSEATRVLINGQAVIVGSSVSDDPASVVLDRFEDHCRKNLAQSAESWRDALAAKDAPKSAPPVEPSYFETGVLRSGHDDGMVVCFNRTAESKPTAREALEAFAKTGNLSAFGALRYVYVKPRGVHGSHVLTMWTDEHFDFTKLIFDEAKGDVRGEDFPEIPRPPSSTRVISTRLDGAPYGINAYVSSSTTPAAAIEFFDGALEHEGWLKIDPQREKELGGVARSYERDGVVLTIFAFAEEGKTFTTLGLAGIAPHEVLGAR